MTLGPILIKLKGDDEGDALGTNKGVENGGIENSAAAQVNEDKKAGKEGARVQSPFIQEESKDDVTKNPISRKATSDDLNSLVVPKSNAKFPNNQTI